MTTTGPELRIRQLVWVWVLHVGYVLVCLGALAGVALSRASTSSATVGWVTCLLAGVLSAAGTLRLGVTGTADGRLVVRNRFGTRAFLREDLADAVVDRKTWPSLPGSGWTVWLALRDGTRYPIQLSQVPFRAGLDPRLEERAAEIRAWTTDTR